jgi:hypothetical protein
VVGVIFFESRHVHEAVRGDPLVQVESGVLEGVFLILLRGKALVSIGLR